MDDVFKREMERTLANARADVEERASKRSAGFVAGRRAGKTGPLDDVSRQRNIKALTQATAWMASGAWIDELLDDVVAEMTGLPRGCNDE